MASCTPLKVLDVCKVTPKSSSPATLSLLFFDVLWLRFPHNQRVFFYESPHPTAVLLDTLLPKLKHSLSLTLQHFLPLAGNLKWPQDSDKPFVQYLPGDGVSLTVAESKADFDSLCNSSFRKAKLFYPLLPDLQVSDSNCVPAVTIQITLFPNAGFSLGFATHHAVMDGRSMAMFVHSWASVCREAVLAADMSPVFNRSIVRVPQHVEGSFLNSMLEENGPHNRTLKMWDMKAPADVVLGTFKMGLSDIEKLKKSIKSRLEKKHRRELPFHLSTFTATSAFTWVCLVKTNGVKLEKPRLAINIDCRARLDPPIPSNYFGNCISPCIVDVSTCDLIGEDGVAVAAYAIAEAVKRTSNGVLDGVEDWLRHLSSVQAETLYSTAGSPHFEYYKADFGWERPRKVELISIDKTGAFQLSDNGDGDGGVEIGVALREREAEDFASIFLSGLADNS